MEIAICPNCGAVIKQKVKGCGACGAAQSRFAATMVPTLASAAAPMVVSVAPDRLILERIVSTRSLATLVPGSDTSGYASEGNYIDSFGDDSAFDDFIPNLFGSSAITSGAAPTEQHNGNGNGHGNGNGNGNGNGYGNGNGSGNGNGNYATADDEKSLTDSGRHAMAIAGNFFGEQAKEQAPWEKDSNSDSDSDGDGNNLEDGEDVDTVSGDDPQSEGADFDQFTFDKESTPDEVNTPFSTAAQGEQSDDEDQDLIEAYKKEVTARAAKEEAESVAMTPSNAALDEAARTGTASGEHESTRSGAHATTSSTSNSAATATSSGTASANVPAGKADFFSSDKEEKPFDLHKEQPAPTRPHVAAPDFFGADKSKEAAKAEVKPVKAASTAAAFDFFADSSQPAKAAKRPSVDSDSVEKQSKSGSFDAHDSFESLLTSKSKPSATTGGVTAEEEKMARKVAAKPTVAEPKSGSGKARTVRNDNDDDDDDDHDEGLRKPAKAKKSAAKSKDRNFDDDDDDDADLDGDNEDGDDDDEIPQRRSFSGPPSSLKNPPSRKSGSPAGRSRAALKKSNDDDDDDEGSSSNLRSKFSKGDGLFTLAGFPVGIKLIAVTLCIVGMLIFAVIHALGNVASVAGMANLNPQMVGKGAMAPMMAEMPKLAGNWRIRVMDRGKPIVGNITVHQSGTKITGEGADPYGPFKIDGFIDVGKKTMNFKKRFHDPNGRDSGPPIFFVGNILIEHVPLHVTGVWEFNKKSGSAFSHLNKATTTKIRGEWLAQLDRSMPVDDPGTVFSNGLESITNSSDSGKSDKPFNIITFLSQNGIWVCAILGGLFVFASFTLFGPSGLINIWNKQQYIPSQVQAQHNKIRAQLAKGLKKGSLPLGRRVEWKWWFPMPWVIKDLALPPEMRKINPHVLVLGQGGKGKTRLVANMVAHDILSDDRAVVLIDSDGTLVDLMTRWISAQPKAKELARRVILIDPTHKGNTSAFNPLELPDMGDVQTAAASIVYGFKAIYTEPPGSQSQWNAQTADILRNAVLLLMANNKTLTDLPNLLNDNDFRDVLLENVERKKDERIEFSTLLDQWGRYKKLARTDQWITWVEPILNRVNPMLSNPRIRSILTKPDGDLQLLEVINNKRILLVKIPQGEFGQDANLLGSLIVSGVKQAALTLSSSGGNKQNPVSLYLDNFDNFIEKETVENITSETKKFKIGFVGVTKSLQHLPEDFRNELIINIGTLVTFALSKKDGDLLGPQMFPIDGRKVKHQTMTNIFNRVNSSPQFELVSDEEKLNIDKVVRQEERTFFAYRMGAEAGLFNLRAHPFEDIPDSKVKEKLIERMHLASSKKAAKIES